MARKPHWGAAEWREALTLLEQIVDELPAPQRQMKRGDVVGWNDEAVEVVLVSQSGNITIRTAEGLKTVTGGLYWI
jgi:hypothetical protein